MNLPTGESAEQQRASGFKQDLEHLRQVPLFQNLEYECLKLLTMLTRKIELIEGDQLMVQGEDDGNAYLVTTGKLESFHTRDATRYHIQWYEAGQFVGSFALLGTSIRLFTVEAVEKSTLLRINRIGFQKVMQKFPDAMMRIGANLADEVSGWEQDQLNRADGGILERPELVLGISLL
ncbi:MAG: cyclic nucleotide-binding domain-containing protein [Desulfofustis sp.]|jgi:CRP-like cAMP-binding protein|nr:cyclic nucleotide-binding domain-containing protein [Desulfofustis sp.]